MDDVLIYAIGFNSWLLYDILGFCPSWYLLDVSYLVIMSWYFIVFGLCCCGTKLSLGDKAASDEISPDYFILFRSWKVFWCWFIWLSLSSYYLVIAGQDRWKYLREEYLLQHFFFFLWDLKLCVAGLLLPSELWVSGLI